MEQNGKLSLKRSLAVLQSLVINVFSLTQAEGLITGTMVKMFTIAGPVIVSGTVVSAMYGLLPALLGC